MSHPEQLRTAGLGRYLTSAGNRYLEFSQRLEAFERFIVSGLSEVSPCLVLNVGLISPKTQTLCALN